MNNIQKINILLLNWNSSRDIANSLYNLSRLSPINYRVILIDNDSKEVDKDSLKEIFSQYKNIIEMHFVQNDSNYGYAGGNNRGYEYLHQNNINGDILILNPDVTILPNTISIMEESLKDDIGAVMCRTLSSDGGIMYDYIKLNGFFQKWLSSQETIVETDYVAGSCMLIKREVINKIGLFDEDFFMYWEEVDLSFRIKKLGYRLVSATTTNITRKENSKERSINAVYYSMRNSFILLKKYEYFSLVHMVLFQAYSFISSTRSAFIYKRLDFLNKYLLGNINGFKLFFS